MIHSHHLSSEQMGVHLARASQILMVILLNGRYYCIQSTLRVLRFLPLYYDTLQNGSFLHMLKEPDELEDDHRNWIFKKCFVLIVALFILFSWILFIRFVTPICFNCKVRIFKSSFQFPLRLR